MIASDVNQFAYIPGPGKGTAVALTTLYLHVLRFLDNKSGAVRVAAVDLSKAFDTLTHNCIMDACIRFELPKAVVTWILSYLSDRRQRVCLNGNFSDPVTITRGVPQGSVIGPLLFSLVIDSLSPVCDNSCFLKYADDLTILHFVREAADDKLQMEIDNVRDWTKQHSLLINVSKCCVLDVITKRSLICNPVFLSETQVENVARLKILGCIISQDLKWNHFVDFLSKKASQRVYLILCLKRAGCPSHLLFRAYCAYIRPLLLYAYPAACNMTLYLKQKLERVEKRVMRLIEDDNGVSLFSVADKICVKLLDKVLCEPKHPLRTFFDVNPTHGHSRILRKSCCLRRPMTRTRRFKDSFIKFCP